MRTKLPKKYCILLAIVLSLPLNTIFADAEEPVGYTIETAVRTGINNSIEMKQLDNEITLSKLRYDSYKKSGDDLIDGKDDVSKGEADLASGLTSIDNSQDALNQARIDIMNGYYPQGFPGKTVVEEQVIPGIGTLPALVIVPDHDSDDTDRKTILEQTTDYYNQNRVMLDTLHTMGVIDEFYPEAIAAAVIGGLNKEIAAQQKNLDKGKADYEKNTSYLIDGKIDYEIAKASIASALANKLNISELNKLSAASEANLLLKMADDSVTITAASKGIYKNQIALRIQYSYYNVLKAQKLVEVRKNTMKRAEVQWQFAEDGYESGMKAKDDVLLANMYYTGTKLEYQKAEDDYDNALLELKRSMGIPLDQVIELDDVLMNEKPVMDISEGIDYGLNNRLEIIKATKAVEIYDYNLTAVKRYYNSRSTRYSEALNLKGNAELELEKYQRDIESGIRQSFNTLLTLGRMLNSASGMVEQAKEYLDIAQDRYKVGFGAESALLKSMNTNYAAGTILEVISAQDNLTKTEEKYLEILYSYNLAKLKYLNDIAYLSY